ncbi:LysR substrate-binding domain-containing protein [Mesorhizobium comanense]|uniref:LysR substrate-binding domain-containing protein n=1 Tax=Mesorhizobium comanense TaxID=2502215 RepID=UPI001484CACE|nr:LysR substrate-binding domain-containing protein [Mesorhizobium comanense]
MFAMPDISIYNAEMIRNLDTALVRTFVTVADRASMTAAANALHLTQGAVSQQVKRLEETLGRSLFERDRRGLRLTRSGERLLDKARRLLTLNDEIWADISGSTVDGQVRLGVPYDLVGTLLAPVLKAYAETYPQVEISLVCASSPELAAALAAGTIDLAVIEERVGPTTGECLAVDRLVWVGARGGVARAKRPLPVSIVADTCAFRPAVLSALDEHGVEWRTVFENGNIDATTATVRSDLAVTTWLASTVPADLDILPFDAGLPPLPNFSINLHLPRHGVSPAAREFARHIRDGLARRAQAA